MQIEILALAGALLVLALLAFVQLISGNFSLSAIMSAGFLLTPHLIVVMLASSRWWVALALGGIGLTFSIPMQWLYRIEFGMILTALIVFLVFLRSLFLHRAHSLIGSREDRLMAFVAVLVLLRILYDRPGSAATGDSGGLAEAFYIGLGCVSYFMMLRLVSMGEWTEKSTFRLIAGLLIAAAIMQNVWAGINEGWIIVLQSLFGLQVWFLSAMALSWALGRANNADRGRGPQILPYLIMAGIMLMAVISPYRSRPVFALAIIISVAYVQGGLRRVKVAGIVAVAMVAVLLVFGGADKIPSIASRSLSIIMPMSRDKAAQFQQDFKTSAEYGWQSRFRSDLLNIAWLRIQEHPILGKGFAFSQEELLMQSVGATQLEQLQSQLALSGVYHNVVVELAVFCGVPLAMLFVLAYIFFLLRFMRFAPTIRSPEFRMFAAALIGLFAAESGQMLMNGGGRDFYCICMLMGAMRGLSVLVSEREAVDALIVKPG